MGSIIKYLIFISIICGMVFVYQGVPRLQMAKILEDQNCNVLSRDNNKNYNNNTKYILYWSPFMNRVWDYEWGGFGYDAFEGCEYSDCFATRNRTFMSLESFDALIFHASYTKKLHGVPHVRSSHQLYIYMNLESPRIWWWSLKPYKSFFNWTMTYRLDSDVVSQYGYLFKKKTNFSMPSKKQFATKTGAAWMVSHCNTNSKREILVKELQKFYHVDIYGKCGNLTCFRSKNNKCHKLIEEKYKFYLSFENSYCKDYITEKLFNVLLLNVVPVVYSSSIHKTVIPPQSIINVAAFNNVHHLADYLKYLDNNVNEYLKYFDWKKNYFIRTERKIAACRLCKKLHQPLKHSVYEDISNWWFGKDGKAMCKKGKKLPRIVSKLLK